MLKNNKTWVLENYNNNPSLWICLYWMLIMNAVLMKTIEVGSNKHATTLENFESRSLIINHRKFLVQKQAF